jgi:hypothetical protein
MKTAIINKKERKDQSAKIRYRQSKIQQKDHKL